MTPALRGAFPEVEPQVALVMRDWSAEPDRVVPGLTAIVNALAAKGGWVGNRWQVVGTGAEEVALTTYSTQRVVCTLAPLLDERLTPEQRGHVVLAILLHEVGHVRGSLPYQWASEAYVKRNVGRNRARWLERAHPFNNLLEDVRTERDTAATFGAYEALLRLPRWWIASRHEVIRVVAPKWRDEVLGFAINVVLYRDHIVLGTDAKTKREAQWWQEWAARWTMVDPDTRCEGLVEALAKVMRLRDRPQPPQPPQPPSDPTESEDESEDEGQGGAGESDEDEDGEQGESEGAGDSGAEDEDGQDDTPTGMGATPESGGKDEDGEADGDDEADGPAAANDSDPDQDEHGGDESEDESQSEHGAFGKDEDPDQVRPEYLPAHVEQDLTPDEREAAKDAAVAQVVSSGTRRHITTRWAVPVVPGQGDALATPERDRVTAKRMTMNGMATMQDEGTVVVETDVIDLARLRAPRSSRVDVDASGVNAMRLAFRVYRKRHDAPMIGHTGRKIDRRRAYRLGADDGRVFLRHGAQSADRLDVHLLVDRSGSMGGFRIEKARTMLATIAEALRDERNVRLTIWSESNTSMIGRPRVRAIYGSVAPASPWVSSTSSEVVRHWSSEEGLGVLLQRVGALQSGGGFHDATAIEVVTQMVEHQPGVQPVLIVLSDGEPIEPMGWVHQVVTRARRQGVVVFGVGMAEGLTDAHVEMYGRQSLVPFTGDWTALGRGIMRVMARLLP